MSRHALFLLLLDQQTSLAAYLAGVSQPRTWHKLAETTITPSNVADNAMYTAAPSAELFTNPGNPYLFTADDPTGYTVTGESGSDPSISEVAAGEAHADAPTGGGGYVNLYTGDSDLVLYSQVVATIGDTLRSEVEIERVVSGSISRRAGGVTINPPISATGTTSVDYVTPSTSAGLVRSATPADVTIKRHSVKKVGEYDGQYSGPTLSGDTFMGLPCPTFDGVNDFVQLEHNRLEALLKPENAGFAMTMMIPILMTQANWEATTSRIFMAIGVDSNNRFQLYHTSTTNQLALLQTVGGVSNNVTQTVTSAIYSKFALLTVTVNKALDRSRLYLNKTVSSDLAFPAGTWSASALTAAFTTVGSLNGGFFFAGSGASPMIWDRELPASEIGYIYDLMRASEPDMS